MRNNCPKDPRARRRNGSSRLRWAIPLALLTACDGPKVLTFTDSEHQQFSATCKAGAPCKLSRVQGPSHPPPSGAEPEANAALALRSNGRVIGLCTSGNAEGAPAEGPEASARAAELINCRPLVCDGDEHCPPAEGLSHGVCINHLCTEPSHAVNVDDAVLLCLAGAGTPPKTPKQVERLALGYNCGTPCVIPKICRQL